jgi:hypothetical protein
MWIVFVSLAALSYLAISVAAIYLAIDYLMEMCFPSSSCEMRRCTAASLFASIHLFVLILNTEMAFSVAYLVYLILMGWSFYMISRFMFERVICSVASRMSSKWRERGHPKNDD